MGTAVAKYLKIVVLGLCLLAAAIGAGLVPINLFFLQTTLSDAVLQRTGWTLAIEGSLWLKLGLRPSLSVDRVVLTAAEPEEKPFAAIDGLIVEPRLLRTMQGQLDFRRITATASSIDYCALEPPAARRADTDRAQGRALPSISIDAVYLPLVDLRCADEGRAIAWLPRQLEIRASIPRTGGVGVSITGKHASGPVRLTFAGDSIEQLMANADEYQAESRLEAYSSSLEFHGTVLRPLSTPRLAGRIEFGSRDLSKLLALFGFDLPGLGALQFATGLQAQWDTLVVEGAEGSLGNHHFRLDGTATGLDARPRINIRGQAETVDVGFLTTLTTDEPGGNGPGYGDLRDPIRLLNSFDGSAAFLIGELRGLPLELTDLALDARLDSGLLVVRDLQLLTRSGSLIMDGEFDTAAECPTIVTHAEIHDLDLALLNPTADSPSQLGGWLGKTSLNASSCGFDIQQHVESLAVSGEFHGLRRLAVAGKRLPFELNTASAHGGWARPGRLRLSGQLRGEEVNLEASFGAPQSLHSGSDWPLTVKGRGPATELRLGGQVASLNEEFAMKAAIELSVARLGELHRWFDIEPSNAQYLSFRGDARLADRDFALRNIRARLGQSDLAGAIHWQDIRAGGPMAIDLSSSRLDLVELTGLGTSADSTARSDRAKGEAVTRWPDFVQAVPEPAYVDLNLSVSRFLGLRRDLDDVALTARWRRRQIEDGRVRARLAHFGVDAEFDLDFRSVPWQLSTRAGFDNVDVGVVLSDLGLAEGIDAQAGQVDLRGHSHGHSLQELASRLELEAMARDVMWTFNTGAEGTRRELVLGELTLSVAPREPLIWRAVGTLNSVPVALWLRSPHMGTLFDRRQTLAFTLMVGTDRDVTRLDASVNRSGSKTAEAEIRLSGAFIEGNGVNVPNPEVAFDDFAVVSKMIRHNADLFFNDLQIRVGQSRAGGTAALRRQESGNFIGLDLQSPYLETGDLLHWVERWRTAHRPAASAEPTAPAGGATVSSLLDLLAPELDPAAGQRLLDIRIEVAELRSAGKPLGESLMTVRSDGRMVTADLTVSPDDGDIAAHYAFTDQGAPEFDLQLHADDFEYGGLLQLLKPDLKTEGRLYLDAALSSRPSTRTEVVRDLSGHVDLLVFPRDVSAKALDLWASNLVWALLSAGAESSKQFNCMVARFEVENGIMKSRKTFLDTTDIIVRSRGEIDLVERELDLRIAPQSKVERFLSVSTPLRVTGPLDDFHVSVAPAGLLTTLIRWYYGLIYVPWKWLTGERFPADGIATCYGAMGWEIPD